jgi:hypothetical protein
MWKGESFKVCSNNILVVMTVQGIFTKISMGFASFCVMMLHHIPELFCPMLRCYIICQKNTILNHTAVITSELKTVNNHVTLIFYFWLQ